MSTDSFDAITDSAWDAFERDGAICLRGVFTPWMDILRDGVQRNYESPGEHFVENSPAGESGSFWDDYCNWARIPEFQRFLFESPMARIAAEVMGSSTAQLFHDHVLVKEPGTAKPTPWHQDAPYYFVDGRQTVSFWLPLDPVGVAQSLKLVAASHTWPGLVRPVTWADDSDFYPAGDASYVDMPAIDAAPEDFPVRAWTMEPGDAVLFHFRTVHGAAGNELSTRRRAFSVRWVGDDARYAERPGRTSPPFPGHGMKRGQRLREDWFPILWPPEPASDSA